MDVDRVGDEVVSPSGVVEVTVGTDDDARTIVHVNQTSLCEVLIQVTHTYTYNVR